MTVLAAMFIIGVILALDYQVRRLSAQLRHARSEVRAAQAHDQVLWRVVQDAVVADAEAARIDATARAAANAVLLPAANASPLQ